MNKSILSSEARTELRRGRFIAPTADLSALRDDQLILFICIIAPTADLSARIIAIIRRIAVVADKSAVGAINRPLQTGNRFAGQLASKDAKYLRESNPSASLYESDIARRWWTLSRDVCLPLSDGTTCRLRFPGRPGGSMGPDVRDAVLLFTHSEKPPAKPICTSHLHEKQVVGDIEFHIRPFRTIPFSCMRFPP